MLNLKENLHADILAGITAAQEKGELPKDLGDYKVLVDHSDDPEHGNYATPVALSLAKIIKKKPLEVVEIIAAHMPKKEYISKITAAAPGFLNIWLNPAWMIARLDNVIAEGDVCHELARHEGKMVNLEFISANPTGPLTLANCRTAFTADTLANVLGCVGYNVTREYYLNDAGAQVKKLGESVLRRIIQAQGTAVEFPETLYQGEYITAIGATIAERLREDEGKEYTAEDLNNPAVVQSVSDEAVRLLLGDIQKTIQEDLKINFDVWTSEKALREGGLIEKAVQKLKDAGEVYEKDGAQFLKTSKYGDSEDRVLVKKDGEYAYFAPDIAYHQAKYDRKFDLIFTFLGADHQGHIPRLQAAMQALGNDTKKLHFIVAQWFRLMRGGEMVKVSKRAGNIITPKELVDEVGYDAARFFLIQHRLDTHMDFDLDLAKERSERNPVYYVQYAYVRLQSILRRAKEQGIIKSDEEIMKMGQAPDLKEPAELDLLRTLYRFPEVVTDVSRTYAVHQLAYYAQELASAIHVFYKQVHVLSEEDVNTTKGRLQLVLAVQVVLGKTLDLLGLGKPNVM